MREPAEYKWRCCAYPDTFYTDGTHVRTAKVRENKAEKEMSGEYVITLVHGTWARKASWTDESSVLCRGLKDQCSSSLLIFERFQWSGHNLFSARKNASNRLVAHMKQLIQRWPNARHYIIAHINCPTVKVITTRERSHL